MKEKLHASTARMRDFFIRESERYSLACLTDEEKCDCGDEYCCYVEQRDSSGFLSGCKGVMDCHEQAVYQYPGDEVLHGVYVSYILPLPEINDF
jgi:hypothetical protein